MAREMKDSGVEWIGEIPNSWAIGQIGQLYEERRTKVSDRDYPPLSVTMQGIVPQLATAAKTDAHDDRKLVRCGDFAINSRSDRRGSCGISAIDGSVSLINTILSPRENMNPAYYNWLFHTSMFSDEFYKWGHGIVNDLWTTGWSDMKKISIPVPLTGEQALIADFLDRECGEIDAVLEKTRASIEENKKLKQAVITQAVTKGIRPNRPMKDSRIMWVGAIPTEWHIVKMKYCVALRSGITMGKSYPHDAKLVEMPYLRVANVQGDHVNLDDVATIKVSPEEVERYRLRAGEVLMTEGGDRDKLGRGCIWNGAIDPCLHQNHVFAVTPNQEMLHSQFLDYLTTSDVARLYFDMTAKKTTNLACTNSTTILNFSIPLPSALEQRAICEHLALQCAKIDTLITKKQQFLAELESYKKSLIYEYVTGKKEVL